ncbi:MAG: nucleoside hydrolase [Caldilineaceae bacterium]
MNYPKSSLGTVLFATTLMLLVQCDVPPTTSTLSPQATTAISSTAAVVLTGSSSPKNVVIDTDMAADDWMAILYLFQRQDVMINAITVTGTGEAHCDPGVRHALELVALSKTDNVLVACGRETPLQGNHMFPASWRDGVDRLLGLNLPKGEVTPSELTAVELLNSVIQSSPDKVTLLTLGPLTNVAEAIESNPHLVDNIEQIYIMGGAVDVQGNVGTSAIWTFNYKAEWNVYIDPFAANVVFQSGAPITLVPLDATNHAPLDLDFYKRFDDKHISSAATFAFDTLTKQKLFIYLGGYYFGDPLTAAILSDESLATFEQKTLCVVESEGRESGWTKINNGCPKIRVAVSVDRTRFEQIFLDTLNFVSS